MKRLSWLVIGVFAVGLTAMLLVAAGARAEPAAVPHASAAPVQMAQMPPGGPGGGGGMGPFGQMSEADRAKIREQMTERVLEGAGLNAKEKAAARKTMKAKEAARRDLMDQRTALQRVTNKAKPTDAELKQGLAAYRAALAQYRAQMQSLDQALVRQLSVRSQARCMTLGILDNGLGMGPGFGGRAGGMGGGRRGQ